MMCPPLERPTIYAMALVMSVTTGAGASDEARPKFSVLRHDEDWSFLADVDAAEHTDFWDPIKCVELTKDGSIWASFGGSTRFRTEAWSGFGFLDDDAGDDTFLLWRALFHADVHFGENVRAFAQGISAQSSDRDLPGGRRTLDVNSLELQQGFLDIDIPLGGDASLTLRGGRQAYLFGKQRLVSPLPWANALRAWDGVTAILKVDTWTVTGFASQFAPVQKYDFDDPQRQRMFYGGYATTPIDNEYIGGIDAYFLGLANRDTVTINGTTGKEDRYTAGARIWGTFGEGSPFDYDVEGAYQFGRVGSEDVNAYMIGSQLGYRAGEWWGSPRFHIGVEMGSGDDDPGGDVETFNQLFPLGHAYFGYADVLGRQNAIDLNLGVNLAPVEKVTVKAIGHMFWRTSKDDAAYNVGGGVLRPGATSGSSEIGQEIDIVGTYKVNRNTTLELGYSHFFPGNFIEDTGSDEDIDFVYLQMRYVF